MLYISILPVAQRTPIIPNNNRWVYTTPSAKTTSKKDGVIVSMSLLTGNYLRVMRQLWQNVEFLCIDEISMVPYQMLCMIDSRLRQLKSPNACFGGINVLFIGDLMQLPPVRGHQVF
ncbi:ATP-dependent DNA helicase [Caerostris darwini]|uniref:ATP-dependent DNA helicase n=1 Tax=Caerostris darwini TaxID=1538125 RepID=A0AAV4W3J9_9ARAC|nr:ATP-dependent DNA helicase [Caerostris darwini]